jgi:hypothetical protein
MYRMADRDWRTWPGWWIRWWLLPALVVVLVTIAIREFFFSSVVYGIFFLAIAFITLTIWQDSKRTAQKWARSG